MRIFIFMVRVYWAVYWQCVTSTEILCFSDRNDVFVMFDTYRGNYSESQNLVYQNALSDICVYVWIFDLLTQLYKIASTVLIDHICWTWLSYLTSFMLRGIVNDGKWTCENSLFFFQLKLCVEPGSFTFTYMWSFF